MHHGSARRTGWRCSRQNGTVSRLRAAAVLPLVALLVASCGVFDSAPETDGVEPAAPSVDDAGSETATDDGVVAAAPVGVELESRLGTGRAVLAATNGPQAIIATTVDVVVRSDVDAEFRPLALSASDVRDVTISPAGDRVLAVLDGGVASLWGVGGEMTEIATLGDVVGAAFRADGSLVVDGSGSLRIVDGVDGSVIGEWTVPDDRSLGPIAIADDGRILSSLIGGTTAEIAVWNGLDEPTIVEVAPGDADAVIVRVVAAGDRVAVGLQDSADDFEGRIAVFPIGSPDESWSHRMDAGVSSAAWALTPDGGLLVGEDSTIASLDEDGAPVASVATDAPIERVTRTGLVAVSNGSILRRDSGGQLNEIFPGAAPVVDLHTDPASGATVFVDTAGGVVNVGDPSAEPEYIGDFAATPVNDVAVAADGRIATASTDGVVNVRDIDGSAMARLVHDEGSVDSVAFADGENQVATGVAQRRTASAWDDTVSVWDPDQSTRVFEIGGEVEEVAGCSFFTNRLRFSNDGTFVVSTSHDFTVSVIAVPSGELLHTFEPHANTVLDIAISSDDSKLVTSADDSTMRVWDLETYELLADHQATMGGYWSLSFLPDDSSVVAGDLTGNLSVIDIATGLVTTVFDGAKLREARTAISPDGRVVAAGAEDSIVRLWSVDTGEIIGEAVGHTGAVTAVAFFRDSQRFVSSSKDGTAIVWTLSS